MPETLLTATEAHSQVLNAESARTGPAKLEISLSPAELDHIRREADHCVAADVVADPDEFADRALRATSALPVGLLDGLRRFRRYGSPTGGLLVRGCPIFDIPETPANPADAEGTRLTAAGVFGIITAVVGDQFGFRPELGGNIIQDLLPVPGFEYTQQSISSAMELYTHVEYAFTDDRADYVALLCLRADHERTASTTLSPMDRVLPMLSPGAAEILRQPRFKTTVDGSFLRGLGTTDPIYVGPIAVLSGPLERPRVRADFAETTGMDEEAQTALDELRRCADEAAIHLVLEPGDLLFVDNHRSFHGRTPFQARWDGTDRWLLRTSLTRDLPASEARRPNDGRIIDTDYTKAANVLRG